MPWKIAGTYVGTCHCLMICPCPTDGKPTGPGGECKGGDVFHIAEGNYDDVDLSGINFALIVNFPLKCDSRQPTGWLRDR